MSVITYAAMLHVALEAAEILSREGIELEILDLRTVSPLDREAIRATVEKTNKVIILHEHARTGGARSAATERVLEASDHCRLHGLLSYIEQRTITFSAQPVQSGLGVLKCANL